MLNYSEFVNLGKGVIFAFGDSQHLFAFGIRQELSALVEQFECVPLLGVVAGSEDDTSGCFLADDRQFGGRGGSQTYVHHMAAHSAEGGCYELVEHRTAHTCITTNDQCAVVRQRFTALGGISRCKTNDIHGIQSLTYAATYRASYA